MKNFKILYLVLAIFVLASCTKNDDQVEEAQDPNPVVEQVPGDLEESKDPQEDPEAQSAALFDFSNIDTVDLQGNPVDGSVFQGKITLVNVWGTFCPPCIDELPDLGQISKDYGGDNFQVLGIIGDTSLGSDTNIEKAKELIASSDVDYVNIIPDQALIEELLVHIQFFPTSFLLDDQGRLIEEVAFGAKDYEFFAQWAENYK